MAECSNAKQSEPAATNGPVKIDEVIRREAEYIVRRRRAAGIWDSDEPEPEPGEHGSPQDPQCLVGLALSGGGMRSATFNLGVLQSLHKYHLLRWFDYLSTVSGGGYIGTALSTLLAQRQLTLPTNIPIYQKPLTPDNLENLKEKLENTLPVLSAKTQVEIVGKEWWYYRLFKPAADHDKQEDTPRNGWIQAYPEEILGEYYDWRQPTWKLDSDIIIRKVERSLVVWSDPDTTTEVQGRLPKGTAINLRAQWYEVIIYDAQANSRTASNGWIRQEDMLTELAKNNRDDEEKKWADFKFDLEKRFPLDPKFPAFDRDSINLTEQDQASLDKSAAGPVHPPSTDNRPSSLIEPKLNNQLYHMRLKGNFIIPRRGFFGRDTLRGVGTLWIGLGHTFVNFLLIFLMLAAAHFVISGLLVPRIADGEPIKVSWKTDPDSDYVKPPDLPRLLLLGEEAMNGQSKNSGLPAAYWWMFVAGVIVGIFWIRVFCPSVSRQQIMSDFRWEQITNLVDNGLGVATFVTLLIVTLALHIMYSAQRGDVYWLWMPAAFYLGFWLVSTFVYTLRGQYQTTGTEQRSLLASWQGMTTYMMVGAVLFGLLGLTYVIELQDDISGVSTGVGTLSHNIVVLGLTTLISTLWGYFVVKDTSKGLLSKLPALPWAIKKALIGLLAIVWVISVTLLLSVLFQSIPASMPDPGPDDFTRNIIHLLVGLWCLMLGLYLILWGRQRRGWINLPLGLVYALVGLALVGLLALHFMPLAQKLPDPWSWLVIVALIGWLPYLIGLLLCWKGRAWTQLLLFEIWILLTELTGAVLIFVLFNYGIWIPEIKQTLYLILPMLLLGLVIKFIPGEYKKLANASAEAKLSKYESGFSTFLADRCQILFKNLWNNFLILGLICFAIICGFILLFWVLYYPRIDTGLCIGILAMLLFLALSWTINLNRISLHYFYRDRLAEAFLQTEVFPEELPVRDQSELALQAINPERSPAPYHLVLTTLNLPAERNLVYKDIKGDPFIFSRYFCGAPRTGYLETQIYRAGLTQVARAMAISGAAFSSLLGYQTFFGEAFFMTMFNLRLGYWMDNPAKYSWDHLLTKHKDKPFGHEKSDIPMTEEPITVWSPYLFRELLALASASKRLVNLSDGGHFDNTGLYPLLQRRCRVIIAGDAGRDYQYVCGDLAQVSRRIYIEEGTRIEIDLEPLRPDDKGLCKQHGVVGRIKYGPSKEDSQPPQGWLIYLKPALTGDEPGTLKSYWWQHSKSDKFPHQPTEDEFYDENQFEANRLLGEHTVDSILEALQDDYQKTWETHVKKLGTVPREALKQLRHLVDGEPEVPDFDFDTAQKLYRIFQGIARDFEFLDWAGLDGDEKEPAHGHQLLFGQKLAMAYEKTKNRPYIFRRSHRNQRKKQMEPADKNNCDILVGTIRKQGGDFLKQLQKVELLLPAISALMDSDDSALKQKLEKTESQSPARWLVTDVYEPSTLTDRLTDRYSFCEKIAAQCSEIQAAIWRVQEQQKITQDPELNFQLLKHLEQDQKKLDELNNKITEQIHGQRQDVGDEKKRALRHQQEQVITNLTDILAEAKKDDLYKPVIDPTELGLYRFDRIIAQVCELVMPDLERVLGTVNTSSQINLASAE